MSTISGVGNSPLSTSIDAVRGGSLRKAWLKTKSAVESAIIAIGVTASILAMFVPVNFMHLPFMSKSSTSTVQAASQPSKPNIIQAGSVNGQGCGAALINTTAGFASCPSFFIDYSKAANGAVNGNYYNIAAGHSNANQELQVYTQNTQNIRVENGNLVLQARNDAQSGTKYTSAKVDTKGKEDFLYGKMVVRAKLPAGIGTWPAIWMLPSQNTYQHLSTANGSPKYLSDGEIDIVEAVGYQPNLVYSVAHTPSYNNNGVDHTYFNTVTIPGNDTSFHNYEMDWTPTTLTFKVDGNTYYTYNKPANADYRTWPFDQPYYLIMNLAVGGTWGGADRKDFPADGVDPNSLPAALNIQSVQYYSYTGQK